MTQQTETKEVIGYKYKPKGKYSKFWRHRELRTIYTVQDIQIFDPTASATTSSSETLDSNNCHKLLGVGGPASGSGVTRIPDVPLAMPAGSGDGEGQGDLLDTNPNSVSQSAVNSVFVNRVADAAAIAPYAMPMEDMVHVEAGARAVNLSRPAGTRLLELHANRYLTENERALIPHFSMKDADGVVRVRQEADTVGPAAAFY